MKRTVPLLIAACCGVVLIITAFIPATVSWGETATVWFDILAAIAFVLGGGNLLKVHLKKVSDKAAGWAYSLITVLTFLLTLFIGMSKMGVPPANDQEFFGETFVELSIDDIPESLIFSLPVDLEESFAHEELPDSVKRQLSLKVNESRVTELKFRGWMKPGQKEELLAAHENLEWQCAIEQLASLTEVAESFDGKVVYHADHKVISVTGVLTQEEQKQLIVSSSPTPPTAWKQAIELLGTRSRKKTTFELQHLPDAFSVPKEFSEIFVLNGNSLELTGPLTPKTKDRLADVFPRVRPQSKEQSLAVVEKVTSLEGGLTQNQKNLFTGLLGVSWNANQLIGVLDDAGKSKPTKKTACELLAEKEAGNRELETTIPATKPDVKLNDQQKKFLREKVIDAEYDLNNLSNNLKEQGDWTTAQAAALKTFLKKAPTIGARNKLICLAMTNDDGKLSAEQFELLLAPYRAEYLWRQQLHKLQMKSHTVKYPWSGAYLQTGSHFWYAYEYAFKPLTATMFSLLAFYVASAAFRAFRAKNFEAFLLLGTAFIVLLGRTFAAAWLSQFIPEGVAFLRIENITVFIMKVINTAGNRAIMIGISLGIISTSLKILLGVDRSYLGSGD